MANPQIEHGHTRIANEILEQIAKTKLNGIQLRILMIIWRYTYGFQRKEHEISLSFLSNAIESSRSQIKKELDVLIDCKIINVVGKGSRGTKVLAFNKNYEEWIDRTAIAVQSPLYSNSSTELYSNSSTELYSNSSTKKEKKKNIKKYTRQRKTYDEDSTYFKMAKYFFDRVTKVAEEAGIAHLIKKSNLQSWADDMRKLIEIDKVDKRLAKEVMDWVTEDDFWRTNVLSAKKLREKFSELAIKMRASKNKYKPNHVPVRDPRDKEIEFQRWVAEGNDPDEFNWSN
jgi:phage replication O-like protein O